MYHLQRRLVSTSIASAFNKLSLNINSDQVSKFIGLPANTGLFNYDLLKDSSGFYLFRENAIIQSESLVKEAINPNRSRKMVEIFDQLSNSLCKVADMAEFVKVCHPKQDFVISAEDTSHAISAEVEKLNTNLDLYQALKQIVKNGDKFPTTQLDQHVAQLFLDDFEQSGIHLDEGKRKMVVKLIDEILHMGTYFTNNISQPRSCPLDRLPDDIRGIFPIKENFAIVSSLHAESENELIRKAAYYIYLYPDDHQEKLLKQILVTRKRLSSLCGFKSFAHRAIKGGIIDTPEEVNDFLEELSYGLKNYAEADYNAILNLKRNTDPASHQIYPWDIPYYTAWVKNYKFSQNISSCTAYFSLGCCMDGLNIIFKNIYGVELNIGEVSYGEAWHQSVIKLTVQDVETKEKYGEIYCDFFERESKPNQDCHFTIQGGCNLPDGSYQNPIVVLCLSLPNPTPFSPSLLTTHMVDNLFHEMGHAMHSMLARTKYQHITGTRCSTDLAEVPSILMEYFSSDPRVISSFARHHITNQPIPNSLLKSWLESKRVFNASETQLQTFYSLLDQAYHNENPFISKGNTTAIYADIHNSYYGLPYISNTAWQLRFGHLIGYGAKYYAYLVSRAVARQIWCKLFAKDPFSREAGLLYRNEVLSHGGGKPAVEIVESILEKDITPSYLAESVLDDVKSAPKLP